MNGLTADQFFTGAQPTPSPTQPAQASQQPITPAANGALTAQAFFTGAPDQQSTPQSANDTPSVGGFIQNVGSSAAHLIGNTFQAAVHPFDTAGALLGTAAGGVEKAFGGNNDDTKKFDAFTGFIGQRYGSFDKFLHTLYTDPVGVAADASAVLGAGGAALGAAGKAADVSEIANAGKVASTVSDVINPFNAVGKAASVATDLGNKAITTGLGYTSRAGSEAAQAALEGNPGFTAAMRGTVSPEDIVATAKQGLQQIKTDRGLAYQTALKDVTAQTGVLDLTPVQSKLGELVSKFNVDLSNKEEPFARSTISSDGQSAVNEAIKTVSTWGEKPEDLTPAGIDLLKRKLDDLIPKSGEARAFITPLKNEVRSLLNAQVPGYEQMTAAYAQTSKLLDEMKQLSLGTKASPQTIINKIMKAATTDGDMRAGLLDSLKTVTGKDVAAMAQGEKFSNFTPKGLLASGEFIGSFFHPQLLGALIASSPRLVGEFLNVLGTTEKQAARIFALLKKPAVYVTAGKASTSKQPEQPRSPLRSQEETQTKQINIRMQSPSTK